VSEHETTQTDEEREQVTQAEVLWAEQDGYAPEEADQHG
jgi:hypothetical protein